MDEPVVWIVDAEHWPRACLRAELLERGYEAIGLPNLGDARARLALPAGPPPRLVIIDVTDQTLDRRALEAFLRRGATLIGIAGAGEAVDDLPWSILLRRPVTLGGIADVVDAQLRVPEASVTR